MALFYFWLVIDTVGARFKPVGAGHEILPITKIMERPADYQAKVVIVEAWASDDQGHPFS
jgi:hypothetical protein